jgi:hypothetical protein
MKCGSVAQGKISFMDNILLNSLNLAFFMTYDSFSEKCLCFNKDVYLCHIVLYNFHMSNLPGECWIA